MKNSNYKSLIFLSTLSVVSLLLLLMPGVLIDHSRLGAKIDRIQQQKVDQLIQFAKDGGCRQGACNQQPKIISVPIKGGPGSVGGKPRKKTTDNLTVIPVPPEKSKIPPGVSAKNFSSLSELLKQATVLILAIPKNGKNSSIGTGFFIGKDHIVTNDHVVRKANKILIYNETIGKLVQVLLVASSGEGAFGSPDLAILKSPENLGITPLSLAPFPIEMQNIFTMGYPGFVIETDENCRKLFTGVLPPEICSPVTSGGIVSAIQNRNGKRPFLVHSAKIYKGNSGGPLFDECGRVVGVNTWLRMSKKVSGRAVFYAQPGASAIKFLKKNGIDHRLIDGICGVEKVAATANAPT